MYYNQSLLSAVLTNWIPPYVLLIILPTTVPGFSIILLLFVTLVKMFLLHRNKARQQRTNRINGKGRLQIQDNKRERERKGGRAWGKEREMEKEGERRRGREKEREIILRLLSLTSRMLSFFNF